jgi:uncharacterized protein (DUF2141 family)
MVAVKSLSKLTGGAALAALLAASPCAAAPSPGGALTLTVNVTDARNDEGRLAVALFASEEDFPRQERALRGQLLSIQGGRATVTFGGLEPGVYAIAVLHDENANSRMDFNFLGIPLEGFGFSNDAPVSFGPPSFKAAAFRLVAPRSRSSIRLRYFWR